MNPDAAFVRHMIAAAERITELVERTGLDEFHAEWVLQNALIRELEILGEAAGRCADTPSDA